MSAVGTAGSYASDIPSLLIGNSFDQSQSSQGSATNIVSSDDRGPATLVDLSDRVKQLLAHSISDRETADRLRALVEQSRATGENASAEDGSSSDQDAASNVTEAFEQLSGGTTVIGGSGDVSVQSYQSDNKEYITFSNSEIAARNVTASSNGGTVSTTSVGKQTGSLTFVVNFATGAISMEQAVSTSVATSVQIGSNQSALSTLA